MKDTRAKHSVHPISTRRNMVFLNFMRPNHAEDCLTFIHILRALADLFEKIERKRNY